MRTFSRADWEASQQAWTDGDFSDEWKPFRHRAAMRGIIYPPSGTRWDSWADDQPSQRAMLIRAIREQPAALHKWIDRASSWSDVIVSLKGDRDELRAEGYLEEQEAADERALIEATPRQAVQSLGSILARIGDSL